MLQHRSAPAPLPPRVGQSLTKALPTLRPPPPPPFAALGMQVAYLLLCVVALDYLHDSWFYWTHRLLHWRPIYKHVHYIHHK